MNVARGGIGIGIAAGICAVAFACEPFEPASGASHAPEGGATPPGVDGSADDGQTTATLDAGPPDATAPCEGSVAIIGNKSTEAYRDYIPEDKAEAYGYRISGAAPTWARCVWYFGETATDAPVTIGVYEHDKETAGPGRLLSQATLSGLKAPAWNEAKLSVPIPIEGDATLWIAIAPTTSLVYLLTRESCTGGELIVRQRDNAFGTAPDPFTPTSTGTYCAASLYLSP